MAKSGYFSQFDQKWRIFFPIWPETTYIFPNLAKIWRNFLPIWRKTTLFFPNLCGTGTFPNWLKKNPADNSVVSFPAILSNGLGPTCALSLCYLGLSVGLIALDVVYTHRNYDKICEMKVFRKKYGWIWSITCWWRDIKAPHICVNEMSKYTQVYL